MLKKTLAALVVVVAALPAGAAMGQTTADTNATADTNVVVEVAKNAGCSCCEGWIARMQDDGFTMRPVNLSNEELYKLKISRGITEDLAACHTATVDGYTVEGHVPVVDVRRLLAEHPDAIGIAVPGMPIGSPGMDTVGAPSMGFAPNEKEPYNVLLVNKDGSTEIFASYPGSS